MSEQQELTITIRFKTDHNPGTEQHLLQILYNYLRPKGIELNLPDKVIEI